MVYLVLKFKKKKQTFTKVERDNMDFFLPKIQLLHSATPDANPFLDGARMRPPTGGWRRSLARHPRGGGQWWTGRTEGITIGTWEGICRVLVQEAKWIHRIYACILHVVSSSDPNKLNRIQPMMLSRRRLYIHALIMCLYELIENPKLYRDSNLARQIRWAYISTLLNTADSIVYCLRVVHVVMHLWA